MIKKSVITAMLAGIFFLTGCGGVVEDVINTATKTDPGTAIIQVDNNTSYNVDELYVKKSADTSWGNNLIASDKPIELHSTKDIETLLCNTLIDIRYKYDNNFDFEIKEKIYLYCYDEFELKLNK